MLSFWLGPSTEAGRLLALRRLLWKYRQLHALRQEREAMEARGLAAFGAEDGRARRKAFARVAREFPGALRELELLGAARLNDRLLQVERAISLSEEAWPRWIPLMLEYHRCLRRALWVKRWLAARTAGARTVEDAVVDAFCCRLLRLRRLGLDDADPLFEREVLQTLLQLHLRPPGGRLLSLLHEELAARHGLAPTALEAILFPTDARVL